MTPRIWVNQFKLDWWPIRRTNHSSAVKKTFFIMLGLWVAVVHNLLSLLEGDESVYCFKIWEEKYDKTKTKTGFCIQLSVLVLTSMGIQFWSCMTHWRNHALCRWFSFSTDFFWGYAFWCLSLARSDPVFVFNHVQPPCSVLRCFLHLILVGKLGEFWYSLCFQHCEKILFVWR